MTLTITLTAQNGAGVNFNTFMTSYFADFTLSGFPYILGGSSQFKGDQIVLLDQTEPTPQNTKAIVLDGSDFEYYFSGHTLSGTLTKVRLATLGNSYNSDGSFDIVNNHIANISTSVEISGLSISNPLNVRGDFHNTVSALMGDGHDGGTADPTLLNGFVWAEAHNVIGSTAADRYQGTAFGDTVRGNGGNDVLDGKAGNDSVLGGDGNDTLSGGSGNDSLTGEAGNDVLDGGTGNDRSAGGPGNDTYKVDSAADQVVEAAGAGADTVLTTASFTLAAGQAVETLRVQVATSGNAVNLTGNALANSITGNNGANVLRGGGGADKLSGLLGNDTYVLENGAAQVGDTGGIDTATSTITRSLLAAGLTTIENLTLVSGNINGTGNNLNNGITGSAGANVLTGGVGKDILRGLAGNDTLIGGVGIDTLAGGTQNDVFVFNAPLNVANRDVINDFANVAGNNDSFQLDNAVMAALGAPGALKANFFFAGAAAHDADDHVIYNKANGVLYYDSNGNAAGGVTVLATLATKPVLSVADFTVI
jgi:Ca2+-binding RTX toxin-like protein